jgi:DNA-directed RNA polymerase II subunit RPB2
LYPNEARLRNLTYASNLYVDIEKQAIITNPEFNTELAENHEIISTVFIGRVPIMVRSKYCSLHNKSELERIQFKECSFDQGGYFIINGGEKVLVA